MTTSEIPLGDVSGNLIVRAVHGDQIIHIGSLTNVSGTVEVVNEEGAARVVLVREGGQRIQVGSLAVPDDEVEVEVDFTPYGGDTPAPDGPVTIDLFDASLSNTGSDFVAVFDEANGYWEAPPGAGNWYLFGLPVVLDPAKNYEFTIDGEPDPEVTDAEPSLYSLRLDHDLGLSAPWQTLSVWSFDSPSGRQDASALVVAGEQQWPVSNGDLAVTLEVHSSMKIYGVSYAEYTDA